MRLLSSAAGMAELRRFAAPDTLVGLDFDGTLAPIRRRPDAARPSARTRLLLEGISRRYPTLVITGRARSEVRRIFADVPRLGVVGNHGIEPAGARPAGSGTQVRTWHRLLEARLAHLAGVEIEDKRYSLSVHYRRAQRPGVARSAVHAAAAELPGARLITGKAVLNVMPAGAPGKGAALLSACRQSGCPRAIYIGDDDTDEDVFALDKPGEILSVRVGYRLRSRARYYVAGRPGVDWVLADLLDYAARPQFSRSTM